jgi:cytoskeletal protein CcmA (bactofilin family)
VFDQRAGAPDQPPAPVGMRELTPQPPARQLASPGAGSPMAPMGPVSVGQAAYVPLVSPDLEASVVARDDALEGTFTSRGTIRVMGRVKGRIEAVRLHVDDGARVEADVVVDEAVIAGEFVGNLTCRQRLEAHPSGRLSGHIETYRVMLHEGARVEGEVHMLPEPEPVAEPAPAGADTVRGSAPVRGSAEPGSEARPEPGADVPGTTQVAPSKGTTAGAAREDKATPPVPRPAPRSAARSAPLTATGESITVAPRAASPVSNGARSGL